MPADDGTISAELCSANFANQFSPNSPLADIIAQQVRRTFNPRVLDLDGFASFRLDYNEKLFQRNYRDPVLISCARRLGAKARLAAQLGCYDTIGQDAVALTVNDLVARGAEPLFLQDTLACQGLNQAQIASLVQGIAEGCQQAGCALLGGQTQASVHNLRPGQFDLVAFAVGVSSLRRLIQPERSLVGDVVLGLASTGLHATGYGKALAILQEAGLPLDQPCAELDDPRSLGQILLTPSRIYARAILSALNAYSVKRPVSAMANVGRGGLGGCLAGLLKGTNLDLKLDAGTWAPPALFQLLGKCGQWSTQQMFSSFNMGVGFVLLVRPHFVAALAQKLRRRGEKVFRLGKLTRGAGQVLLA
ncbi:MAG: phosphoribosylformylglycinamidine cyclo-ligase [Phycisphaeraceae bacterium]|nr:phosphoribosylformylglycinamidine cyclo-ligase [Phycisphaeraceae bacterium]